MLPRLPVAALALTLLACSGGEGPGFDESESPTSPQATETSAPATQSEAPATDAPTATAAEATDLPPTDPPVTETPAAPTPTASLIPPTEAPTPTAPLDTPTAAPATETPATPTEAPVAEGSLRVQNQILQSATAVNVIQVVAVVDGFVVIHEDADGAPGEVIGSTFVAAGDHTDVVVSLSRDIGAGEDLFAMLHDDTGNPGVYAFPDEDPPSRDSDGEVIVKPFKAWWLSDGVPAIAAFEQTSQAADKILVAGAVSVGPGFAVIHEQEQGGIGPVVGFAPLVDGVSREIPVTLFRDVIDGETLYAMLHADGGTVGDYVDNTEDPPVKDGDGAVIVEAFVVKKGESTSTSPLEVSPQPADTTSVIADAVRVDQPSWLVVFEAGKDGPGQRLGYTGVAAGEHFEVEVALSRATANGETLVFEVYIDAGQPGVLEIPDPDEPAKDQFGGPISELVQVGNDSGPGPGGSRGLEVENQQAGESVALVNLVSVPSAGWVAVHEDSGGALGSVLGHAAISTGTTSNLEISLSRPMELGEHVVFAVYEDLGQVGVFEVPGPDALFSNNDGGGLQTTVDVTETGGGFPGSGEGDNPFLQITDQPAGTYSVAIRKVDVPGASILAIQADNDGDPGEVLGYKALSGGPNEDFFIELSRPTVEGETLFGVLYNDANSNGLPDPGSDPILSEGGSDVVVSFLCSGASGPP